MHWPSLQPGGILRDFIGFNATARSNAITSAARQGLNITGHKHHDDE
jgi:hypothetical protein